MLCLGRRQCVIVCVRVCAGFLTVAFFVFVCVCVCVGTVRVCVQYGPEVQRTAATDNHANEH